MSVVGPTDLRRRQSAVSPPEGLPSSPWSSLKSLPVSAARRFLHGIAERTREERPHLCKVINTPLIVDPELREAVEAAIKDRDQGRTDKVDDVVIRETRISLTFRDVERVSKGLGGLLNKR